MQYLGSFEMCSPLAVLCDPSNDLEEAGAITLRIEPATIGEWQVFWRIVRPWAQDRELARVDELLLRTAVKSASDNLNSIFDHRLDRYAEIVGIYDASMYRDSSVIKWTPEFLEFMEPMLDSAGGKSGTRVPRDAVESALSPMEIWYHYNAFAYLKLDRVIKCGVVLCADRCFSLFTQRDACGNVAAIRVWLADSLATLEEVKSLYSQD